MISTPFQIHIEGSEFLLMAERAVFWPKHQVLICSDLHWGRELFMQKHGIPIPDLTSAYERKILEGLIERLQPKEWWILGDFIHHPHGLPETFWTQLRFWCETLIRVSPSLNAIYLVPGNHDRNYHSWTEPLPLIVKPEGIRRDRFLFRHEPRAEARARERNQNLSSVEETSHESEANFFWYGHLHPAVSLPLIGHRKLPCFWIREKEAYLPAFSRLAGGQEIDPDFRTERAIAIGEGMAFEWYRGR